MPVALCGQRASPAAPSPMSAAAIAAVTPAPSRRTSAGENRPPRKTITALGSMSSADTVTVTPTPSPRSADPCSSTGSAT